MDVRAHAKRSGAAQDLTERESIRYEIGINLPYGLIPSDSYRAPLRKSSIKWQNIIDNSAAECILQWSNHCPIVVA
jgi:hypothetical protein